MKFKFHYQTKVEVGPYIIDKNKRTLSLGRKIVKLTEKELDIIIYLYGKKDGATKKDIMKIFGHIRMRLIPTPMKHTFID